MNDLQLDSAAGGADVGANAIGAKQIFDGKQKREGRNVIMLSNQMYWHICIHNLQHKNVGVCQA